MTPRQEIIKMAAHKMRMFDIDAGTAVEIVVDECRACEPRTLGAAMLKYYRDISEEAIYRLDNAVRREAL
jgi:hypothetical protein